jgi:hypothetical protein
MGRKAKYVGCKREGCNKKHYTRGFCSRHATAFYRGDLDEDGNALNGYKEKPDASYCKYPGCGHRGTAKSTLRRGLCNKHRKWREKGYIDADCNILQPDKIPKKRPLDIFYVDGKQYIFRRKCVVEDCLKESRSGGFCEQHRSSFYMGNRNRDGTPTYERKYYNYKKDKCKVEGCNHIQKNKRLVKGFCLYHYNNHYRKGKMDIKGKVLFKKDRRFKNGSGN